MTQNLIVMAAPLGRPGKRVRLAKTISLLKDDYRCEVVFWGWKRVKEETLGANLSGVSSSKTLVRGGGYRSRFARLLYLYWMIRVFFAALVKARATGPIYCLGLETALPVWAASRFRRSLEYIFDDADRLVLIWSLPTFVKKAIVYFEKKVSRDALTHIIPSYTRYDYKTARQYEITNSPNADQVKKARGLKVSRHSQAFNVYVNGWLDATRGLTLINNAANILRERGNHDIAFNVAVGNLTDKATDFFDKPNVNYLGNLSHIESLAQYNVNDVVLTFYDPAIRINQFAIPNKWGDAVAMGTPIIVNAGIRTAEKILDRGAALRVSFDDPEALADILYELSRNPEVLSGMRTAIEGLRPDYRPFNEMMAKVLEPLFPESI